MKIIREHGGPPIENKTWEGSAEEFWKEISRIYNSYQENEIKKLTNWRSARNKYAKIKKRIEKNNSINPEILEKI